MSLSLISNLPLYAVSDNKTVEDAETLSKMVLVLYTCIMNEACTGHAGVHDVKGSSELENLASRNAMKCGLLCANNVL